MLDTGNSSEKANVAYRIQMLGAHLDKQTMLKGCSVWKS